MERRGFSFVKSSGTIRQGGDAEIAPPIIGRPEYSNSHAKIENESGMSSEFCRYPPCIRVLRYDRLAKFGHVEYPASNIKKKRRRLDNFRLGRLDRRLLGEKFRIRLFERHTMPADMHGIDDAWLNAVRISRSSSGKSANPATGSMIGFWLLRLQPYIKEMESREQNLARFRAGQRNRRISANNKI